MKVTGVRVPVSQEKRISIWKGGAMRVLTLVEQERREHEQIKRVLEERKRKEDEQREEQFR